MSEPTSRTALRRAVVFTAVGLVLHVLLCLVYAGTVGRAHDAVRQDAKWLYGPMDVDLMIAGDSHPRFAVEAPLLGFAINVAVPGEHYLKTMYRVPWLLDRGERDVKAVILPFDAGSFSSFKSDSFEPEYVWGRYVDFLEVGRQKGAPVSYAGKWLKARAAPYVGELDTMLQWAVRAEHFREPTGERSALSLTIFEAGPAVARRHFEGANPWDPVEEWAFRRLVDDLVRRGIRVILVRFPTTGGYIRETRRLGVDPAMRDRLYAEIGKPGVIDHLDFEEVFVGRPELFGDADHLNPLGKREFTKLLAPELVKLGVIPERRRR